MKAHFCKQILDSNFLKARRFSSAKISIKIPSYGNKVLKGGRRRHTKVT
jgi:hypothetical protein